MTDERASSESREQSRPSWLHDPRPDWCTREHHEDDHPEDRIHQDDGVVIAANVGDPDPLTLAITGRATELVIQRCRSTGSAVPTWVRISETEGPAGLTLTEETAGLLQRRLNVRR